MKSWHDRVILPAMHVLAVFPLVWLVIDYFAGNLSADPIQDIQRRTGLYAIILLAVSLAGTPLYRLLGFSWLKLLRRLAGLYGFGYVTLHLLNFLWLDYGFNLTFLREALLEKRYALAGLIAYILLIPAAITSTAGWQRRLGLRRWKILHWLVYPAAFLATVHYIWQGKLVFLGPIIFALIIGILLLLRLPPLNRLPGIRKN